MLDKLFSSLFNNSDNKDNHKKRILVVEDNDVDRKLICKLLSRANYQYETAEDGETGLKMAQEMKPDLILADCEMPKMGGLDMCRAVKEIEELKDTPVLFLTSLETPKNIIDCFEADAENYLNKPINAKALLAEIKTALMAKG